MLNGKILTQEEGRVGSDAVGKTANDVRIARGIALYMHADGRDGRPIGKPLTGRSRGQLCLKGMYRTLCKIDNIGIS